MAKYRITVEPMQDALNRFVWYLWVKGDDRKPIVESTIGYLSEKEAYKDAKRLYRKAILHTVYKKVRLTYLSAKQHIVAWFVELKLNKLHFLSEVMYSIGQPLTREKQMSFLKQYRLKNVGVTDEQLKLPNIDKAFIGFRFPLNKEDDTVATVCKNPRPGRPNEVIIEE